jgi:putative lipoprotein
MSVRALLPLLLLAFFAACSSNEIPPELEDPARVMGTLTYMQRVTLPEDAVVTISLFVLPRPGSPASLVNEMPIPEHGQVPIPFEIWYRRDTIDEHKIYALKARIDVQGQTWFENRDLVPVITNHALRDVEILLDQVPH